MAHEHMYAFIFAEPGANHWAIIWGHIWHFYITHNRLYSDITNNAGNHQCRHDVFLFANMPVRSSNSHAAMIVMPPVGVTFTRAGMSKETEI